MDRLIAGFALVLLLVLAFGGSWACRNSRINSCVERDGQPVVPAWFTDEPHDVRCIEAVN